MAEVVAPHSPAPDTTAPSNTVLEVLGCRLRAPDDVALRLDQPCVRDHGSLAGLLTRDGDEVAFTLLWRPLGYFALRQQPPEPVDAAAWRELHDRYVEAALASTRRDAVRADISDPLPVSGPERHGASEVTLTLRTRRRRMRSAVLHRRQLLWTCPDSRRHLAFEVSALAGSRADRDGLFESLRATLGCHRDGLGEPCPDGTAR